MAMDFTAAKHLPIILFSWDGVSFTVSAILLVPVYIINLSTIIVLKKTSPEALQSKAELDSQILLNNSHIFAVLSDFTYK